MRTSFCKAFCGYFRSEPDNTDSRFGCHLYSEADHCPVSYIKSAATTQYEVWFHDDAPPMILDCAFAVCPDPSLRLKALGQSPVESATRLRSRAAAKPFAALILERTREAIANFRVGPDSTE